VNECVDRKLDKALFVIGMNLVISFTKAENIAWWRMVIATANKFPGTSNEFYNTYIRCNLRPIKEYLIVQINQDLLKIENTDLAAKQFFDLCLAEFWHPALLGILGKGFSSQIEHNVQRAVDMFLRLHQPRFKG